YSSIPASFKTEAFGIAPIPEFTTSPFSNTKNDGTLITLYLIAILWLSSTSKVQTFKPSCSSFATSLIIGVIVLQGPHHVAQKSTNTFPSAFNTSSSKLLSVITIVSIINLRYLI